MNIKKDILMQIISDMPKFPPEVGGILGGDKNTITEYLFDSGIASEKYCCYTPDVFRINQTIKDWKEKEIFFMGIFHTHFWGVKTLSDGDKRYINEIMRTMPKSVEKIYFPIMVLPELEMISYFAYKEYESVRFGEEETIIV